MFKTILIPTDLSPKAAMAIKKGVQLAGLFHAKIILLNIHEEFMDKKEKFFLIAAAGNNHEGRIKKAKKLGFTTYFGAL